MAAVHTGPVSADVINFPARRYRPILGYEGQAVSIDVTSAFAVPWPELEISLLGSRMTNDLNARLVHKGIRDASELQSARLSA